MDDLRYVTSCCCSPRLRINQVAQHERRDSIWGTLYGNSSTVRRNVIGCLHQPSIRQTALSHVWMERAAGSIRLAFERAEHNKPDDAGNPPQLLGPLGMVEFVFQVAEMVEIHLENAILAESEGQERTMRHTLHGNRGQDSMGSPQPRPDHNGQDLSYSCSAPV